MVDVSPSCQDDICHCHLYRGRPLAVVQNGQLPECLAHAESAEHLAVLDDLVLALGGDIEVVTQLPLPDHVTPLGHRLLVNRLDQFSDLKLGNIVSRWFYVLKGFV